MSLTLTESFPLLPGRQPVPFLPGGSSVMKYPTFLNNFDTSYKPTIYSVSPRSITVTGVTQNVGSDQN